MFYPLPRNVDRQRELMNRFMRENLAVETNIMASRRRPQPVRNLTAIKAMSEPHVMLTWTGPQNMSGVVGFNVYLNNENNRIQNIANPLTLSATIALVTTGSKVAFFVSAYTAILESIKTQVIIQT